MFCYDYVKPKFDEKPKLFFIYIGSFIVQFKTNSIYKDFAEDVETRCDLKQI